MEPDELSWAHTRAEWEQAWNQVRHFETMRAQWLGFFFTAVLGVTAIAGPKLDASSTKSILVIVALALILEAWSAALYLAVARLNEVHLYNDQIIFAIRDVTMSSPPAAVDLTIYKYPPHPPREGRLGGSLASTKKASELVLLLGVFLFASILAGDVVRAATFSRISTLALVASALGCSIGVCIAGFCVWVRRRV
jgi:hypothetical protein